MAQKNKATLQADARGILRGQGWSDAEILSVLPDEITPNIEVSSSASTAAELEISANHLRALKECTAPLGVFVQKAIDKALERYRSVIARG